MAGGGGHPPPAGAADHAVFCAAIRSSCTIASRNRAADEFALAVPGASIVAVVRAARLAGAHDFVLELPHGDDTEVGQRGATLSGGQRQRIAIARAVLGEPRILILDEVTSALDHESERAVRENMRAIARERTVVVIAHRLAAVRDADRIVVVERGRIVEDGTHEELVEMNGRYAALWGHQIGTMEPVE